MRFRRGLRLSLAALSARKRRVALAIGSVALGVAAVVVTSALGQGARGEVLRDVAKMGTNLLVVRPGFGRRGPVQAKFTPPEIKEIGEEDIRLALASEISDVLKPREKIVDFSDGTSPRIVLFVGVNGSGKTTTIAKLGARLQADGATALLGAADTFRAAAADQAGNIRGSNATITAEIGEAFAAPGTAGHGSRQGPGRPSGLGCARAKEEGQGQCSFQSPHRSVPASRIILFLDRIMLIHSITGQYER